MIKVLCGIQDELIKNYISEFISEFKIEDVVKLNYEEVTIESVIEECSYLDLFSNSKLIILNNSNFLTAKETLDSKLFEKYLSSPNPNSNLFLVVNNATLDERKRLVKLIRKNYEIKEFNNFSTSDALEYAKSEFKKEGYSIEDAALKRLVEYLSTNFSLYKNEITKLKLYKYDEKAIELCDVIELTSKVPEDNVFKLTDAVVLGNKEEIFKIYNELKDSGVEEIALVALLSSQFRFIYQLSVLKRNGKTNFEISSMLGAHPYKVEVTMKKINLFKEEKLLDILCELSLIDISIKTGEKDKNNILENFFLNL